MQSFHLNRGGATGQGDTPIPECPILLRASPIFSGLAHEGLPKVVPDIHCIAEMLPPPPVRPKNVKYEASCPLTGATAQSTGH